MRSPRNWRAIAALVPDNAYGTVIQAAFSRSGPGVAPGCSRSSAIRRIRSRCRRLSGGWPGRRAGRSDLHPGRVRFGCVLVQGLTAAGINPRRTQLIGSGLWDNLPEIFSNQALQGAWYAAPEPAGYRNFAGRYRTRFGRDPVRAATLSYDAVSLVAALVKTQGAQRFTDQVLANPSGFSGIDGIFRFRADGTNERGLAVLRRSRRRSDRQPGAEVVHRLGDVRIIER